MRLSPVLLAIFTASAILGQAFTARSQTLESDQKISIDLDHDVQANSLAGGQDLPTANNMANQIAFAPNINQPIDDLLNDLEIVDQTIDDQPINQFDKINKVNKIKSLVNQDNLAVNSTVQRIETVSKQNIVKKFDSHTEKIAVNKFAPNDQEQINTYQSNWLKKYNITETSGKFSQTSIAQSPDISQSAPPPPPPATRIPR